MTFGRRWVVWIGGGFITVLLAGTAVVYLLSGLKLRHVYDIPVEGINPSTDSAAIARGGFLAQDLDCNGCHGDDYAGAVSYEAFGVGRIVAPNLTEARGFTDEQWERAIRFGVKPNGEGMIGMPSRSYYFLTDAELAALIGYFESLEPVEKLLPETTLGLLGRVGLVLRWFDVEPELVDRDIPRRVSTAAPPERYGKYVGMTNCGDCHGTGRGRLSDGRSNRIPRSYSDHEFFRYLRAAAQAGRWIHRFTDAGGWR